ncbi:MAG: biopolymer transporter ExbD [Planctomycetota bacterium]|nr:biopolymer transporter ExbD [Planctomycetota bacterium]
MTNDLIVFNCPDCDAVLSARLDQDGDVVVCPQCGTELIVPDPDSTGGTTVAEEARQLSRRKPADDEGEMDTTPMVDVTFLLLIFFMVTAAFAAQKSFEIPTPNPDQPSTQVALIEDPEDDPTVVTVRIDEYNTYYVTGSSWDDEQEAPTKQELMSRFREAQDSPSPPTSMLIIAHPECSHEKVVSALDAGNAFKMEDIKLMTADRDEL